MQAKVQLVELLALMVGGFANGGGVVVDRGVAVSSEWKRSVNGSVRCHQCT